MGEEVPRLPGGASVGAPAPEGFGGWFARERELRGISLEFVAARLKLPRERLVALESGRERLGRDGRARSTARALAEVIGADPRAALACLEAPLPPRARRAVPSRVFTGAATGTAALLALALVALGAWGLWQWARSGAHAGPDDRVYRPDYLRNLRSRPAPGEVEGEGAVRQTDARP